MPSVLCNRVQRILPLVNQVADGIISEETKILKDLIPRMFEAMYRVAKLSCEYVKCGMDRPLGLTSADDRCENGRSLGMIEEMERELTEVIEGFDRAMSLEAIRLANETSKLPYSQSVNS